MEDSSFISNRIFCEEIYKFLTAPFISIFDLHRWGDFNTMVSYEDISISYV